LVRDTAFDEMLTRETDAYSWRCPEQEPIIPNRDYYRRYLKLRPARLAPLEWRLMHAIGAMLRNWNPWYQPEVDIYGVPGRIDLRLAWTLGWILCNDLRWPARREYKFADLAEAWREVYSAWLEKSPSWLLWVLP
jgi:hypothetical protein